VVVVRVLRPRGARGSWRLADQKFEIKNLRSFLPAGSLGYGMFLFVWIKQNKSRGN